jgi:hypothetical protein
MIHGFNKIDSQDINEATMQSLYLEFLRAMKLTRQTRYRDKALH